MLNLHLWLFQIQVAMSKQHQHSIRLHLDTKLHRHTMKPHSVHMLQLMIKRGWFRMSLFVGFIHRNLKCICFFFLVMVRFKNVSFCKRCICMNRFLCNGHSEKFWVILFHYLFSKYTLMKISVYWRFFLIKKLPQSTEELSGSSFKHYI